MSTPDLALIDTDVASVLYRSGLFQRVMPAELVQAVTDRSLAISVITLGEASYGALLRKWSPWRTAEMLEFYTGHFAVVELGREARRSNTGGSGRQPSRSVDRLPATTSELPRRRLATACP